MCNLNEQADRRKCFPSLDDLPVQEALSMSRIIGILYRFRDIPTEQANGAIQNAEDLLKKHIRGYSKASQRRSVENPDMSICDICSYAAELLRCGDINYDDILHKGEVITGPSYRFQEQWLSNMGLLIPLEPGVIEILPFLLLCYTANAPYNKLDPFKYLGVDETGKEGIHNVTDSNSISSCSISDGWFEIFPDFQTRHNYKTASPYGNLKRNIRHLAEYCTRLSSPKDVPSYSSLLNLEGVRSDSIYLTSDSTSKGKTLDEKKKILLQVIKDWELYRRFAAFCDACDAYERQFKEPKFNLTLSMALFAQFWKLDIIFEKYLDDQELIQPITWEDAVEDRLHEEIVDATQFRGSESNEPIDIHGIVCEKKSWFLRSYSKISPDCTIVYSQSIDLDSDAFQ